MKKIPAKLMYFILRGSSSFFFTLVFTASSVFYIEKVGLNPLQLVLVGTFLEIVCFFFEIPTGIVADIYSRRLSVIIGMSLIGAGFALEGALPFFIAVLAAQVLWGIGATFISGAEDAWIVDEVQEKDVEQIFLKGTQVGQLAALLGIVVSMVLGSIAINLPIILGGVLFILLAVFLIIFMPEERFQPANLQDLNSLQKVFHTFGSGIRVVNTRPLLLTILGIAALYGLASEGFDRLWTAHFMLDALLPKFGGLKPIIWVGIINAVAMVLSIFVVEVVKRRFAEREGLSKVKLLFVMNFLLVISVALFGFAAVFPLAIAAYWTSYVLRHANGPLFSAWVNEHLVSETRATVLSMFAQVDAFGQILGGPLIGFVAVKLSVSIGIAATSLMLAPILLLYLFVLLKERRGKWSAQA